MNDKRRLSFTRSALIMVLACGVMTSSAYARDFSNLYIFGDSLSDSGTFAALVAPSPNGKFTTYPGTVWGENLGAKYGKTVTPAYNTATGTFALLGSGNDFAIGGARVNATPGVLSGPIAPLAAILPPVSQQVTGLLGRGSLDTNALYAVWAGANDIFTQMGAVGLGLPVASAQTALVTAANDLAAQVARLRTAGARNIIVISVPNIGATPYAASGGAAVVALASGLTTTYNAALAAATAGSNALYFDGAKLFAAILADPSRYGFSNTSVPACGTAASLGCVAAANGALFADGVHPTSAAHRVISDWVYSSLEASGRMSLLSSVPMGRSGAQWRTIDGRMREFQNFGYQGQGFFVTGDYSPTRLDATANSPSASGAGNNMTLGYERALADNLFGGVTLGYARTPFDLGDNLGKVKYDEWAASAFVSKRIGPWYGNLIATHTWLDFTADRNVSLGPAIVTETGDTKGRQTGVKAQLGYNFVQGSIVHGPLAGVAWERVTVDGYSEKSGSATAMTFGGQTREQLRSRLGWQVEGNSEMSGMRLRPYAQLDYEYQHKKDDRSYTAGFVNGPSAMSVASANRTGGYGLLAVGGTARISKTLNLGLGATTTFSQPGARNSSISLTLSWPL
jgi:outer membrane lipase/esterase